ncbi:MAG: 1-acyl-sn-glycerol-3-phosphate acyltransferase [Acidobacteria bacterium]|nr:1-acyl-sn-glycerol-3-phosphate acyltransferase [Acidobacteriota bacterium]
MKTFWLWARTVFLWAVSALHFFPVCTALVLLGIFVDPRKNDRPQRWFFRNILRFAGVGFEVQRAPSFDPGRTSIFLCNHVNLFDAFVIYSAIPQLVRGWEFESHFRIPAYGWMMRRFGNIPVPAATTASGVKQLFERTKQALDSGVSIIVFPEGSRTLNGRVGPFRKGIFQLLPQLQYPVVPMSIVGSFEFNRKGSWLLRPSNIVVHLHDTIETKAMSKDEAEPLKERAQQIVAKPVEEFYARGGRHAED